MCQYSTGLELILNACEGVLQIAITDNEAPLAFEEWFAKGKGTEILAPALQNMFDRLGIKARQFRRIGCFAGPGSFTGIRLILTTAAALRRVTSAQLASLDYMQALATTAVMNRGLLFPINIMVLTHARKNLVHCQQFISYGPQIPAQPVAPVRLEKPGDIYPAPLPNPLFVCGGAFARHPELFKNHAQEIVFMPEVDRPSLDALRLLARHGDYFPKDVEPHYVRSCDAVDNLEQIAQKEGQDPDLLKARLEQYLNIDPANGQE